MKIPKPDKVKKNIIHHALFLTVGPIDVPITRHCPRLTHLAILESKCSMKGKKGLMWLQVTRLLQTSSYLVKLNLYLVSLGVENNFMVHHRDTNPHTPHLLPGQPPSGRWWSTQDFFLCFE
jgi:hypothetical protein